MKYPDFSEIEKNELNLPECTCAGNRKAQLLHLRNGLGRLLLSELIFSIVLAYALAIIDGLRFLQWPVVLPFSAIGQYQPQIESSQPKSPVELAFDNFVFLYNCAFPGGSRLGCGIGMIGAAFWNLYQLRRGCQLQRLVIGLLAGMIIGFRMTLMISSSANLILFATVVSSIAFAIYMVKGDKKPSLPSLPIVQR